MFFDAFWYARQSFLAEQQKKAKNCVKFKVHEPYWKVDVASVCLFVWGQPYCSGSSVAPQPVVYDLYLRANFGGFKIHFALC